MIAVQPHSHTYTYGEKNSMRTYLRLAHANLNACSLTKQISKGNLGADMDLS